LGSISAMEPVKKKITITIETDEENPELIRVRSEFGYKTTTEEMRSCPVGKACATMLGALLEYAEDPKVEVSRRDD
jgi:hypothetical protein